MRRGQGMGSKGCRRRRTDSAAATSPRSFYKIILPSIIEDQRLRIPEDFAKIYEDELSSLATLTVPSSTAFRVRVAKVEKMLWFLNGWKEFADHHSIRCGFFLVFDYEGNSKFMVHIFDLTATEIQYPKSSLGFCEGPNTFRSKRKVSSEQGTEQGDLVTSSHLLMSSPSLVSSETKKFNECSLQGRKRKRCFHSVLPILYEFAPEFAMRINKFGNCILKSSLDGLRSNSELLMRFKRCKVDDLGETTKSEDAVTCKSPSKAIVLRPSSLIEPENDNSTQNDDDHSDQTSSFWTESEFQNRNSRTTIKGQHLTSDSEHVQLAKQTNLDRDQTEVKQEEGVELLGSSNPSIFLMRSRFKGKEKALNAALTLKLKNPYFMNILKQYNVEHSFILPVPAYFADSYLSTDAEFLRLEGPDGKRWKVTNIVVGERVQYLSRGWSVFVRDNNLAEGDVCIFELIQVDDVVLKVHIFHASQTSLY